MSKISLVPPLQFSTFTRTVTGLLNTVFQNTTNTPILVTWFGVPQGGGNSVIWNGITDASNPPTTVVASAGLNQGTILNTGIVFIVKPNHFWKVTNTGSAGPNVFPANCIYSI